MNSSNHTPEPNAASRDAVPADQSPASDGLQEHDRAPTQRKSKRARRSFPDESARTDRRIVPPTAKSLLSITREQRLTHCAAKDILSLWASSTGASWRSGEDSLCTVPFENLYAFTGRSGSGHMTMHWNTNEGVISAKVNPDVWARHALITLARMVFPLGLEEEDRAYKRRDDAVSYGREYAFTPIDGITDKRARDRLERAAQEHARSASQAKSLLVSLMGKHGIRPNGVEYTTESKNPQIICDNRINSPQSIDAFHRDPDATTALRTFHDAEMAHKASSRQLQEYAETCTPRQIHGLSKEEFERWPTPNEWNPYACRELAIELYRMSDIRRAELDRLMPEKSDYMEWRFDCPPESSIDRIRAILIEAGVEITGVDPPPALHPSIQPAAAASITWLIRPGPRPQAVARRDPA